MPSPRSLPAAPHGQPSSHAQPPVPLPAFSHASSLSQGILQPPSGSPRDQDHSLTSPLQRSVSTDGAPLPVLPVANTSCSSPVTPAVSAHSRGHAHARGLSPSPSTDSGAQESVELDVGASQFAFGTQPEPVVAAEVPADMESVIAAAARIEGAEAAPARSLSHGAFLCTAPSQLSLASLAPLRLEVVVVGHVVASSKGELFFAAYDPGRGFLVFFRAQELFRRCVLARLLAEARVPASAETRTLPATFIDSLGPLARSLLLNAPRDISRRGIFAAHGFSFASSPFGGVMMTAPDPSVLPAESVEPVLANLVDQLAGQHSDDPDSPGIIAATRYPEATRFFEHRVAALRPSAEVLASWARQASGKTLGELGFSASDTCATSVLSGLVDQAYFLK